MMARYGVRLTVTLLTVCALVAGVLLGPTGPGRGGLVRPAHLGDEPPVRRDAEVAGPTRRVIQHRSNRVLDPVAISRLVRHGEALCVG